MHNKENENTIVKATIKNIIVAFIYVAIIVTTIGILLYPSISLAISLVNGISVDTTKQILKDVKIDLEHNKLTSYPGYGTRYANIVIEDLDIDLPLYFGDTLKILRNGVGQSSGGYFPGEGGSIICMGHNNSGYLRRLPEIEIGTKIQIKATYGTFTYVVYDTKIVPQENLDAVPIQDEEEILMLYTCYPVNSIGHAKNRFITYAKLEK